MHQSIFIKHTQTHTHTPNTNGGVQIYRPVSLEAISELCDLEVNRLYSEAESERKTMLNASRPNRFALQMIFISSESSAVLLLIGCIVI